MLEQNLSKIGFSPSEIKVYLHLVKNGSSYANKISSETKINRTNVYEALDRLCAKGVVSFITRNKVKWLEAKNFDSLRSYVKQKEEELEEIKNNIYEEIDYMKIGQGRTNLEVNIFVGKKGLRALFDEIIKFLI